MRPEIKPRSLEHMASDRVEKVATSAATQIDDAERREALRKMAKLAAYTAPAMIALLTGESAVFASPG
jgi:hypothetical protein